MRFDLASLAGCLILVSMSFAFTLGFLAHIRRRELAFLQTPFSAYLSGSTRALGLWAYAFLCAGIAVFVAESFSFQDAPSFKIAGALFVLSIVSIAIAAGTANPDQPQPIDNPRVRRWHRAAALGAFASALAGAIVQSWTLHPRLGSEPLIALASLLSILFFALYAVPARIHGGVQKLLMIGFLLWFSLASELMQP